MVMELSEREFAKRICRESCAPWWETFGKIDTKEGDRVTPVANEYQAEIAEVIQWMRSVGLPVRMIDLKPRQKGSSTYNVAEVYHEGQRRPITALIVGGSHEQSSNLYRKLKTYAKADTFKWGTRVDVNEERAKFFFPPEKDGEPERETLIKKMTAANEEVGRSDTYQFLLLTEPARWSKEGVANDKSVITGLVKTVGNVAGTTIIFESTADGASGDFYERYWKALPFAEFKAAFERGENMVGRYVRIFRPWFSFADSRIKLTEAQANDLRQSIENPTDAEKSVYGDELADMQEFSLDMEQMAWRRWAIDEECDHDPQVFEEDYPSTEERAFISSGSKRFNTAGIQYLRKLSRQRRPEFGVIEWNREGDQVAYRPTSEGEHTVVLFEPPKPSLQYVLPVDVMTGASQNGSKNPDNHAVMVLRRGFFERGRGWRPPMEVARLRHPNIWDIDVLEEHVYRLSKFYGDCVIIPEMNMDRGLVELLKLRDDANIYTREKFNERTFKTTEMLGWMTDPRTRPRIIETLARAIREYGEEGEGIEVFSEVIIHQLEVFVRKENGREEAANGQHDDWVLSLAIGLQNLDYATTFNLPALQSQLPMDILLQRRAAGNRGKKRQYS